MSLVTDPRFGYVYGWNSGDSGWGDYMNSNLQILMLLTNTAVEDRNLTAPPGGESIGQVWIPAATATGDWAGEEDNLAIWWQTPSQASPEWLFIEMTASSTIGMTVYVKDEAIKIVWNGTAWTAV